MQMNIVHENNTAWSNPCKFVKKTMIYPSSLPIFQFGCLTPLRGFCWIPIWDCNTFGQRGQIVCLYTNPRGQKSKELSKRAFQQVRTYGRVFRFKGIVSDHGSELALASNGGGGVKNDWFWRYIIYGQPLASPSNPYIHCRLLWTTLTSTSSKEQHDCMELHMQLYNSRATKTSNLDNWVTLGLFKVPL